MAKLNTALMATALAIVSTAANAQFGVTNAGPLDSATDFGDPSNSTFSATYTGSSTIFSSFTFGGDLTSQMAGTWESDSAIAVSVPGSSVDYSFTPSGNGSYSGTVNVAASFNGLFWYNNGDVANFETFQGFDNGPGVDATWSNVAMDWSGSVTHFGSLGTFAGGSTFLFDTAGSTGIDDTELALFSSTGTMLGTNDDTTTDLLSSLDSGALAAGDYVLVLGGYNSFFANGIAVPGSDAGTFGAFNLNLNGSSVSTGSLDPGTFKTYTFTVAPVPEPASMAALGLGVAALLRRRRK